ncbi:MAG: hypothetical protein V3T84_01895 [Phycisphaerales bacterium]
MRQDSDHHNRRSRRSAAAVLCLLFSILVWPVVLSTQGTLGDGATDIKYPTSEMGDQRKYHEQTILAFAEQWPIVDLVNYPSATSPGYHLLMALVARYMSHDLVVLQFASGLLSFGLLLVVWGYGARHARAWPALGLVLPLVASSYVIGSGIWLVTDNAGLLFVCLALGGAMMVQPTAMRTARWGLYATCAAGIRQIHVWVAAPVILAALLGSPLGRYAPRHLCSGLKQTLTMSVLFATLPVLLLPLVMVGLFILLWGGLTPPAYAGLHTTGFAPVSSLVALALVGSFGIFFLPAFCPKWTDILNIDRWLVVAVILAVAVSLIFPTSYEQSLGRWGGAIWVLVGRMPDVAGRSIVFPPLAALGAVVLVHAWRAAGRAGRAREATVLLLSLLGWMIAESVNTQSGQRYCEPMILVGLAWLAALSVSPTKGTALFVPVHRLWWAGPVTLGAIQLVLSASTVYLPVLRWHPSS